jgi:hypothetical protein
VPARLAATIGLPETLGSPENVAKRRNPHHISHLIGFDADILGVLAKLARGLVIDVPQ